MTTISARLSDADNGEGTKLEEIRVALSAKLKLQLNTTDVVKMLINEKHIHLGLDQIKKPVTHLQKV